MGKNRGVLSNQSSIKINFEQLRPILIILETNPSRKVWSINFLTSITQFFAQPRQPIYERITKVTMNQKIIRIRHRH